ncbi:unnamed protein product [Linum tenue]|uniref:Uncharacterized protein n=1 Tax=Linum tenue TaxID=586396 RepID=A0AAV0QEC5_9ROSI|nr:unnamed protein product [Linum tenue]
MGGSTGSFPPLAPFFMAAQADPSSVFQAVQTGWGRDLMESRDAIDASIVTSAMNLLQGVASSRVLEARASQDTPVRDDVTLEEQWIRVRKARIQELETQLLSLHRQMEQERSGRAQDQAALAEMKLLLRREQEKVVEARESLARERARARRLEQQVARHGEFMSTAATQFFQLVMDVLRDYYPMVHLNENFIRTEVTRRWGDDGELFWLSRSPSG